MRTNITDSVPVENIIKGIQYAQIMCHHFSYYVKSIDCTGYDTTYEFRITMVSLNQTCEFTFRVKDGNNIFIKELVTNI